MGLLVTKVLTDHFTYWNYEVVWVQYDGRGHLQIVDLYFHPSVASCIPVVAWFPSVVAWHLTFFVASIPVVRRWSPATIRHMPPILTQWRCVTQSRTRMGSLRWMCLILRDQVGCSDSRQAKFMACQKDRKGSSNTMHQKQDKQMMQQRGHVINVIHCVNAEVLLWGFQEQRTILFVGP